MVVIFSVAIAVVLFKTAKSPLDHFINVNNSFSFSFIEVCALFVKDQHKELTNRTF
ncbi:hypothetical protein HMPREF1569_0185 [Klebsiella oxytoca OK-1]|nr:hypothetical protein HMPREF1569_0185 [Klebsiella oxytoca OK-1]